MKEEIDKVVYFDGICGLCDWFVNLLVKIDTNNNLKFSSLQGKSGQILLCRSAPCTDSKRSWFIFHQ